MAINDWWAGDTAERYWMEITDREDLGIDLNAPTRNGASREEWGYTLVTETKPGDVVLHWHRSLAGPPALVGRSTITGPLSIEDNYTWMAHGTRGRARGRPTTGQGWRMPCHGFERLGRTIGKSRLAELEPRLSKLRRAIEAHAVHEASQYYLEQGATRVEELGKPYDLRVIGLGPERHVEVKGSSVAVSAVELTVNEVTHAHNHKPTDLVVVDRISVSRQPDGEYVTSGGIMRIWRNWEPDHERLAPTQYRYSLE